MIHVSIGTEPSQWLPTRVLVSSIQRRTSEPVQFSFSWTPSQGWHSALTEKPKLRRGTRFSAWRWIVPELYPDGRAIYLDADQVVLGDIAELWGALSADRDLAMVRDAVGVFGKKTPESGKWQTSVMVMAFDRIRWDAAELFRKVEAGEMAYADLMQATWIEPRRIQAIDPAWNHFGIRTPETKLIHWSHVASQPWKRPKHATADVWRRELDLSIAAGHVLRAEVLEAIAAGFVHHEYATA